MGVDQAEASRAERGIIGFGHVLDDSGSHIARCSVLSSLIDSFSQCAVEKDGSRGTAAATTDGAYEVYRTHKAGFVFVESLQGPKFESLQGPKFESLQGPKFESTTLFDA